MSGLRICGIAELPEGTAVRTVVAGEPAVLVRVGERVFAIGDTCSHEEVPLSEGAVDAEECTIECWRHGSLFSLETGDALTLPATAGVPVFPVRIEGDDVVMGER